MKVLNFYIIALVVLVSTGVKAQCDSWVGKPIENDAANAHSVYRQALKNKEYNIAFEYWQTAYKLAPAADGKRDYHYTDGIEIYKHLLSQTTDEAKKKEYSQMIISLYDQAISCYLSKSIALKSDTKEAYDQKIGYLYGRKAYDMFYFVNSAYEDTKAALDKSIEYSGQNAEYIIFDPYGRIIVWEFKNGQMTKEKAVELYKKLTSIGEYNIANNEALSEGYQQALAAMDGTFREIEKDIFDCEFFKDKLIPEYEENKDDPEVLKRVLYTLKTQGCLDSDPVVAKLDEEWKKYVTTHNEKIQSEFEANNPAAAAKAAYDDGKYQEAISKYRIAISEETESKKKAIMLFAVASIEFRKLSLYSQARKTAYEAAKMDPNWGNPYMLIGDMYAKTARSCGDAWNQRLAILAAIDKYSQAKSIDSKVAGDAQDRINNYYSSLPEKSEGFMRGVTEGQSASVGCWIGETVRLRFKS